MPRGSLAFQLVLWYLGCSAVVPVPVMGQAGGSLGCCLQWDSLAEKSCSSCNGAGLSHCGKCETWMGQGLEEEGLQELSFTDSEFSALTW